MIKDQLSRLSKSAFVYGLGQVLNRFIGFLLLPLFTAYLSPADYGILALLGLISFIANSLFSLGIPGSAGISYFENNSHAHKEETIWTFFFILLISTCILLFCGVLFPRQISFLLFRTEQYACLVIMTFLSAGLTVLVSPFMLYLQFEERAKLFVTLTLISTIFTTALSCFLVMVLKRGVNGMVESTLIGSLFSLLLFAFFAGSQIKVRLSFKLCRRLLSLGVPLIPAFFMVFVIQHGNKYILQWLTNLEEVGIYNIGFNLGMAMSLLVSALQSAWFPFFMSFVNKHDEAGVLFGRILTYYVFAFGSISLLFFIVAKPVIMIMTQPEFYEAYKIVGLSAGASFISGIFFILLPGIYFAKEVRYVSIIQTISASISIVINLALIHLFGLLGAALALVFSFVTMVIGLQVWNYRRRRQYILIRYEWKRIAQYGAIYVFIAIFMLWDRHLSLFGEIMLSLSATCILPFLIYAFLNSAERIYLKSLYNR